MAPHHALQPPGWLRPLGHANGVEARGRQIFLAGQVRQALNNITTPPAEAGPGSEHITRMNWYLVDKQDYLRQLPEIGLVYHEVIGRQFPPTTALQVQSLMEDDAKVEIEVTAAIDDSH